MNFPDDEVLAKYLKACLRIYLKKRIVNYSFKIVFGVGYKYLNHLTYFTLKKRDIKGVDIAGSVYYYILYNTKHDYQTRKYCTTRMLHYLSQSSVYLKGLNLSVTSDVGDTEAIKEIFRFAIKGLKHPNATPQRLFGR